MSAYLNLPLVSGPPSAAGALTCHTPQREPLHGQSPYAQYSSGYYSSQAPSEFNERYMAMSLQQSSTGPACRAVNSRLASVLGPYGRFSGGYYSSEAPTGYQQGYYPATLPPITMPPTVDSNQNERERGAIAGCRIGQGGNTDNVNTEHEHRPYKSRTASSPSLIQSRRCVRGSSSKNGLADPLLRAKGETIVGAGRKEPRVNWAPPGVGCERKPASGALQRSVWSPQYNRILTTPTFIVHVMFQGNNQSIAHGPMRFHANRLIEFENNIILIFREDQRFRLRQALENGYSLVLFRRGHVKRVPVHIRGGGAVHPDAGFTGFLNAVHEGATVAVQWD